MGQNHGLPPVDDLHQPRLEMGDEKREPDATRLSNAYEKKTRDFMRTCPRAFRRRATTQEAKVSFFFCVRLLREAGCYGLPLSVGGGVIMPCMALVA